MIVLEKERKKVQLGTVPNCTIFAPATLLKAFFLYSVFSL